MFHVEKYNISIEGTETSVTDDHVIAIEIGAQNNVQEIPLFNFPFVSLRRVD